MLIESATRPPVLVFSIGTPEQAFRRGHQAGRDRGPIEIAEEMALTAIVSDGVQVASEAGLVALKVFRRSRQDEADIIALIKTGRVDLSGFPLPPEIMSAFRELVEAAAMDPHPP